MARIMKWGNGKGVLLPHFVTTAFGLQAGSTVTVAMDTEARQIVLTPVDTASVNTAYFVKASKAAKSKAELKPEAW